MDEKGIIDQAYITELQENNRQLNFILGLMDKAYSSTNSDELIDTITKTITEYFLCDGCNFGNIKDGVLIIRENSVTLDKYELNHYPLLKSTLSSGEIFSIENIATSKFLDEDLKVELIKKGVISFISKPMTKDGNVVGVFTLIQNRSHKWTRQEMDLLEMVAKGILTFVEMFRSKEELEKISCKLREKEGRLTTIINSMDANVWIADKVGQVSLIGGKDKIEVETNLSNILLSKIIKNHNFFELDGRLTTMEDLTSIKSLGAHTIIREGLVENNETKELLYREFRTSPIIDENGEVKELVIVSTDIKEGIKTRQDLEKREKEARELAEELKRLEEVRVGFLSSLSHELRNPLATIDLGLDLMDYAEGNIEDQKKTREILKRQATQLIRLVDDLLNMTRISQNRFELDFKEVQVNALFEELMKDNLSCFNKKGIILEGNIAQEKIIIQGDKIRLRQVIENILNNSLKFTSEKGRVTITLKEDQASNQVYISIKDTGKGIPENMLENIFEPYVQARNEQGKSSAGLGIGLPIVKDIIERHKGSIRAFSQGENMGTEMIIRLPIL